MKNNIVFLLILIPFSFIFAQREASNWYFGEKAGLNFTTASVTTLTDGNVKYHEGIASISDCRGKLLFYTDATRIWTAQHAAMINGDGLNGHFSATQGALIVPHPGDCNLFYVFTVDGKEHGFANGLQYHIVDIHLQNGSGEVISKNNLLYPFAGEKLTAVKHQNGKDIWVVTHEMYSDIFYAHLVTSAGIDPTPVTSTCGSSFSNTFDGLGQMKISPDGKRLAYVTLVTKRAEVFDFDNATGKVSSAFTITASKFTNDGGLYGVEFSPNGNKLYITNHTLDYLNLPGSLYQVNLLAGTPNNIINSTMVVGANAPLTDMRGLQLGPGGKLYVARSLGKHLGVVENPDAAGTACHYTDLGLSLNGQICNWTLPNFLTSYFSEDQQEDLKAEFISGNYCVNNKTVFTGQSKGYPTEYNWNFGDSSTSGLQNPSHLYSATGEYEVTLIVTKECCTDTTKKVITIEDCFYSVHAPNAFSPNGDGINDFFLVKGTGIQSMQLIIFNRWGERVFESGNQDRGWDGIFHGADAPSGIYRYLLNVDFQNGEEKQVAGQVLITR